MEAGTSVTSRTRSSSSSCVIHHEDAPLLGGEGRLWVLDTEPGEPVPVLDDDSGDGRVTKECPERWPLAVQSQTWLAATLPISTLPTASFWSVAQVTRWPR